MPTVNSFGVARISPPSDTCLPFWDELLVVHKIVRRLVRLVRVSEYNLEDRVRCPARTGCKDVIMLAHEESRNRTPRLYLHGITAALSLEMQKKGRLVGKTVRGNACWVVNTLLMS